MQADSQNIKNKSKLDKYEYILSNMIHFFSNKDTYIASLANFTALLKDIFDSFSWVGFYLVEGNLLTLGPFQGKVACTEIAIGRGVCGKAAESKETIIVQNVHLFQDHIACDSGSNSEIVVPILHNGDLICVLDIDSYIYSNFDEIDKTYLEKITIKLVELIDNENGK